MCVEVQVRCITCEKTWTHTLFGIETDLIVYGFDFCGTCRREMYQEFESQFKKPRSIKIRTEDRR